MNANWIWHLLSAGEMTFDTAKVEIIRTAKSLPRGLDALARHRGELSALAQQASTEKGEGVLRSLLRPSRHLPAVDAWKEEHAALASSRKFLVLDGTSCTGKTVFALQLVAPGRARWPLTSTPARHCCTGTSNTGLCS